MGLLIDDIFLTDSYIEDNISFADFCMIQTSATVVSLFYTQQPYSYIFYGTLDYMLTIFDTAILAEILKTSFTLPGLLTSIAISSIIQCDLIGAFTALIIHQISQNTLDKNYIQLLSLASTISLGTANGTTRFSALQTYKYFYLLFYYYFNTVLGDRVKEELNLHIAVLAYLIYHLPTLPFLTTKSQTQMKNSYYGIGQSPDVAIVSHVIFHEGASSDFYKVIPYNNLQYTELEDSSPISNLAIVRLRFGIYSYKITNPEILGFKIKDFISNIEDLLDAFYSNRYVAKQQNSEENDLDVYSECEVVDTESINEVVVNENGYVRPPDVKFDGIPLDFGMEKEFLENKTLKSFIEEIKNLGFIDIIKKTQSVPEVSLLDEYIKKYAKKFSMNYFQTISIPVFGQNVLPTVPDIKFSQAENEDVDAQLPKLIFGLFSAIFIGRFPPLLNLRVICLLLPYYTFFDFAQAKTIYKNLILGNFLNKEKQKVSIGSVDFDMHKAGFANAGYLYSLALPALAGIFLEDFIDLYTNSKDLNDFVGKLFERGEFYFNYIYKKIREL